MLQSTLNITLLALQLSDFAKIIAAVLVNKEVTTEILCLVSLNLLNLISTISISMIYLED